MLYIENLRRNFDDICNDTIRVGHLIFGRESSYNDDRIYSTDRVSIQMEKTVGIPD